jgi:hypothetical protein
MALLLSPMDVSHSHLLVVTMMIPTYGVLGAPEFIRWWRWILGFERDWRIFGFLRYNEKRTDYYDL